jgi:glyoxylate carboligase
VVIAVPEDVLTATVRADAVAPQAAIHAAPRADDVMALRGLIAEAARPLVLAGRSLDRPAGREALRGFLERWDVPTVVSFRAQDLFPNAHRLFAGDMGLANPADYPACPARYPELHTGLNELFGLATLVRSHSRGWQILSHHRGQDSLTTDFAAGSRCNPASEKPRERPSVR